MGIWSIGSIHIDPIEEYENTSFQTWNKVTHRVLCQSIYKVSWIDPRLGFGAFGEDSAWYGKSKEASKLENKVLEVCISIESYQIAEL